MRSPTAIFEQVLKEWDERTRGYILESHARADREAERAALKHHEIEVAALRREFSESLGFRGTREICSECSQVSAVGFKVPDDVWLAAVPAGREHDILCIACFARFADRAYLRWETDITFQAVSKRSHREECQGEYHAEVRRQLLADGDLAHGGIPKALGFQRTLTPLAVEFTCPECERAAGGDERFTSTAAYAAHVLERHQLPAAGGRR